MALVGEPPFPALPSSAGLTVKLKLGSEVVREVVAGAEGWLPLAVVPPDGLLLPGLFGGCPSGANRSDLGVEAGTEATEFLREDAGEDLAFEVKRSKGLD